MCRVFILRISVLRPPFFQYVVDDDDGGINEKGKTIGNGGRRTGTRLGKEKSSALFLFLVHGVSFGIGSSLMDGSTYSVDVMMKSPLDAIFLGETSDIRYKLFISLFISYHCEIGDSWVRKKFNIYLDIF